MSIRSSAQMRSGKPVNRPTYLAKFLKDAHRLVALGFDLIRKDGLKTTAEEVITEKLVLAINGMIEAEAAPQWMRRYHAADDLRLEFPNRHGKSRPRVDVEIVYLRNGPRPRFHFEAKRLGPGNYLSDYLGEEGLGCFVNAQYARGHDEGGMLGYVQSDTCDNWAAKIETEVTSQQKKYSLVKGTNWEKVKLIRELSFLYKSQHNRPTLRKQIAVYHSLLCC